MLSAQWDEYMRKRTSVKEVLVSLGSNLDGFVISFKEPSPLAARLQISFQLCYPVLG